MKTTIFNQQKDFIISGKEIDKLVKEILSFKKIHVDEVIVHLVDVDRISQLHLTYFDDPSPTDCISFPIDSPEETIGPSILGEFFICPKMAAEEENPYEEISLYIIHCLLHLLGFDDTNEKEKKVMEEEQNRCLEHAKKQNLLLKLPSV